MSTRTPDSSCRAILHFMQKLSDDHGARKTRALFQDLAWKAHHLRSVDTRQQFIRKGLELLQLRTLQSIRCAELVRGRAPKLRFDIGIVTVLPIELEGLLASLEGAPPQLQEDVSIGADRYWFRKIERDGKRPLTAVITVVSRPRNVPCALATERLIQSFSVKGLVLSGIAAGLKEKVQLGDIVCAERVIDYEHVRKELEELTIVHGEKASLRSEKVRPEHMRLEESIANDVGLFRINRKDFKSLIRETMLHIDQPEMGDNDQGPKLYKATIASGEKLIADGSLVDIRLSFDERMRAADQDSSGFAQACILRKPAIPWAIFRGIADYGDGSKNDDYHLKASVAAGCAAVAFLKQAYREPVTHK